MIKLFRKTVLLNLGYTDDNSNSKNITDAILKIILKYRNHPSIFI